MSELPGTPPPAVGVRTATLGDLPLLAVAVPTGASGGDHLLATVQELGLAPLAGLVGVDLPRGARLGFVVDGQELRLRDASDVTLLRAPREGLDPDWLEAARRLKGTMTVVASDVEVPPEGPDEQLVAVLDAAARAGRVVGAIVGLAEERPTLPLLLL
ncbi:hypothetical protein FTX61_02330 [Nitriliruptoraceae bacterium ZYF776]|nr:hypothetical protein [Profundirhabdus halotolerans]